MASAPNDQTRGTETRLSLVALSPGARAQLQQARSVVVTWTGLAFVALVAVVVATLAWSTHFHWAAVITPLVIAVGLLAFGLFRINQMSQDLAGTTLTRFSGDYREWLTRPTRKRSFLRVKLPGSFMLLRSAAPRIVTDAAEAGRQPRWTRSSGRVDYSTRSRLLLAIERDPV